MFEYAIRVGRELKAKLSLSNTNILFCPSEA
jgi:hypothetical protein